MFTKRRAKFMMAGGLGSLVVALTVLLLLVLPATNPGSISSQAQPDPRGARPGAGDDRRMEGARPMGPGDRDRDLMGPRMGMPGMPGMGEMGMGWEEEIPEVNLFAGDPFEPARPNPFQAGAGVELEAIENIKMAATSYGLDWARVAFASRVSLVAPDRRPEREAEAVPEPGKKRFMRVSSILWTAGKPLAIFETADGRTGSVQPGDIVNDWLVEQIGQDFVLVRNVISGACRRVLLKRK